MADLARWLEQSGDPDRAQACCRAVATRLADHVGELPGPVGECNLYAVHPRGRVLLLAHSRQGLLDQLIAALAEGNRASVVGADFAVALSGSLPPAVAGRIEWLAEIPRRANFAAVLIEPRPGGIASILAQVASIDGPIPIVQTAQADGGYRADWLVEETSTAINTSAAGGNASLMALV
jgi:RHH-type proline utilization regulon transcriptional repressor/proline dehydrogenase/delta 1-pyrroline-5-carboxylate dehydrogenase